MSVPQFDVLIVGGGFSGTLLAVHLLRHAPHLEIALLDKNSAPGRGVAYGTQHACHRLNVPAGKMSALPDDASHFLRWAREHYDSSAQEGSFLPRQVYGEYVGWLLQQSSSGASSLAWMQDEVLSLEPGSTSVIAQVKSGGTLGAKMVVLATGNFPPANPQIPGLVAGSKRYVAYAWSPDALQGVPAHAEVLLVGSGLTSLDLALALRAQGFTGCMHLVSRRGLLPQPHQATAPWPLFWNEQSPRSTRGLLRLIREQVQAASRADVDWRAVIDCLRPVTQDIWRSLPVAEQRRFLRHLRAYWEVHRHRIAPELGKIVAEMIGDGSLKLYGGRVIDYRESEDAAEVVLRERRCGRQWSLRVHRVVNCTGSETDCRRIDDALITNLFAQGLARPDALALGLDVDENGAVLERCGTASSFLYAIGPVRKGCLWETTAVPEIRVQAAHLAEHLAKALAGRREVSRAGT